MDYYRTLKLDREPFSNSPDPGLFFNSRQHLEALQQLEISIRLKRGLSVITGEVGTGKTTLSRQLIQKISYDPGLDYFLILDPGFSSTGEFLRSILTLFTGKTPDHADDTALKEQIKACLFNRGVDRKTTTILLIDEGQKLPVFCLEVLRELLNYETNDHKLLQIIIFAQKEFDRTIQALDNFNDRIDFRYTLSPLGFFETRQLIRFRLEKSGGHTSPVPPVFSFFAFAAIFRYSRGYPRKIINLCHHVMIRMIIKNRSRAGYFFVIACAKEVFAPPGPRRFRPAMLAVVLLLLSGGVVLLNGGQISRLVPGILSDRGPAAPAPESLRVSKQIPDITNRSLDQASRDTGPAPVLAASPDPAPPGLDPAQASDTPAPAALTAQAAAAPAPAGTAASAKDSPAPAPVMSKPQVYGWVRVPVNETLTGMTGLVYGSFNPPYIAGVLAANPKITNPDHIAAGMLIAFPVVEDANTLWDPEDACICLARESSFSGAFAAARNLRRTGLDVRILPGWDPTHGFSYAVVVNQRFDTPAQACAHKAARPGLDRGECRTTRACIRSPLQS